MDARSYDVVVVGAGAAGLNAALLLGRARRRVAVVDAGAPRNAPAAHMRGFLTRDGMSPAALLEVGRAEVAGYGVTLIEGRVEEAEPGFRVRLAGGPVLEARRILVATGLRDELPDIPGVRERWGKDLLHCPYCHGWEVRDEPLGVLGTHPNAVDQGLLVRSLSDDVVFFPHTAEVAAGDRERLAARGIRVVDGEVKRLVVVGDRLHGVELVRGGTVPRAAVFLVPRMVPRDAVLRALGCETRDGWVVTGPDGRTSVPGVHAAGNVADPRAKVVTAAGMGAAAAMSLNNDLVQEDTARALAVAAAFSARAEAENARAQQGDTAHGL
ncbi:NAD(P)/FAD-dependent oxidoreductase [Actinomadura roseirufa]|uniref:NAD(P)/FAD-dependent oxidoreductase n=1 Tax=Actinomadura roseirufa TaxID=2094049 RepID=UPI001041BC22|nr:NAD(P)/FAD-dependent oxidoreductase [Actinomadura roseirufa]